MPSSARNDRRSGAARRASALAAVALAAGCSGSGPSVASPAGPPVAWVGSVAIARTDFVAAYRQVAIPPGAPPPAGRVTARENSVLQGLVQKAIVWIEARRVGVARGVSLHQMLRNDAYSTTVYAQLFNFAARTVPAPRDPRIVGFAQMDQDNTTYLTPGQMRVYQRWQARRDAVASRYFGRILHRYAARVRYARGFHPPPPYE
jgi:hypothetical protein